MHVSVSLCVCAAVLFLHGDVQLIDHVSISHLLEYLTTHEALALLRAVDTNKSLIRLLNEAL